MVARQYVARWDGGHQFVCYIAPALHVTLHIRNIVLAKRALVGKPLNARSSMRYLLFPKSFEIKFMLSQPCLHACANDTRSFPQMSLAIQLPIRVKLAPLPTLPPFPHAPPTRILLTGMWINLTTYPTAPMTKKPTPTA